jgi:hypothetical protein
MSKVDDSFYFYPEIKGHCVIKSDNKGCMKRKLQYCVQLLHFGAVILCLALRVRQNGVSIIPDERSY